MQRKPPTAVKCFAILLFCLSSSFYCSSLSAQTDERLAELKQRVLDLVKQTRYTEALPLLERVVVAEPDNAEMHFYLGFALIAQASNTKDQGTRKALRIRARSVFVTSKELKIKEPLVDALIQSIPLDGSDGAAFSQNIAANSLMTEAAMALQPAAT